MKVSKLSELYTRAENALTHKEAVKVLKKAKKAELKAEYKQYCDELESTAGE